MQECFGARGRPPWTRHSRTGRGALLQRTRTVFTRHRASGGYRLPVLPLLSLARMAMSPNSIARIEFGKQLRKLRLEQGLTMAVAARAAGLAAATWGRYENGTTRPGIDKAPAIAKALGLPIAGLYPTDDGTTIVAELRVSAETLAAIRKGGHPATTEVALRIAHNLEPRLLQLAQPASRTAKVAREPRKRADRTLKGRPELLRRPRRSLATA